MANSLIDLGEIQLGKKAVPYRVFIAPDTVPKKLKDHLLPKHERDRWLLLLDSEVIDSVCEKMHSNCLQVREELVDKVCQVIREHIQDAVHTSRHIILFEAKKYESGLTKKSILLTNSCLKLVAEIDERQRTAEIVSFYVPVNYYSRISTALKNAARKILNRWRQEGADFYRPAIPRRGMTAYPETRCNVGECFEELYLAANWGFASEDAKFNPNVFDMIERELKR